MQVYKDLIRRFAWGTDGSFYRKTPKVVVRAESEADVQQVLRDALRDATPVTFRAAGTSLSGQSVSDSILMVAGKSWEKMSYDPSDTTVYLEPGIVGAAVNKYLGKFGRHFGPDPASIGSCMVGGIVANNASGMSCGILYNSDRMLLDARIILADGTLLDTGDPSSRAAFAASHPGFLEEIGRLQRKAKEIEPLIRHKYAIKNVTGLNLLPLISFEDPFEVIAHLMVGSEGTLAFLSRVHMKTLPVAAFKASAMIYFPTIRSAAEAVVAIPEGTVSAAEMLDRRSLLSVKDPYLEGRDGDITAVLTEVQATSHEELETRMETVRKAMEPFGVAVHFTEDPKEYAAYWAIRAGIFPTVGGLREKGTTCLIEDVAFHLEDLPQATEDLSALLDKHGYMDSCIYGHALAGNFHFIINQSFQTPADVQRYADMIQDVADLVVDKYGGSLKAEHGTGRNMAPFVEREWGSEAFALMKAIKHLFDPSGILNPGVIFNDDPDCYIKDFKSLTPLGHETIDKCIECGFCEVNCTSCGFTLSSRTRIAVQREIARLKADGSDPELLSALEKGYKYLGDETCAADGLCSMSCPMGINVADLTHHLREESASPLARSVGKMAANHFHGGKNALRGVLALADVSHALLGSSAMSALGRGLHKGIGLPLWTPSTPKPYKVPAFDSVERPDKVVYFPSCLNQMMGLQRHAPVKRPLVEETVALLEKAGFQVIFPEKMDGLCCGMIWESKGQKDVADRKSAELSEALMKASDNGKYPILCDQSPCLHRMRQNIPNLHLYGPVGFIKEFLLDRLVFEADNTPVVLHPTCSTRLMGLDKDLVEIAKLCSTDVRVPEGVGCCGFAGDKGMMRPELNEWSLRKLRAQVSGVRAGYSNSRTCEIGLETHSGIPYMSVIYLVNAHTKAK